MGICKFLYGGLISNFHTLWTLIIHYFFHTEFKFSVEYLGINIMGYFKNPQSPTIHWTVLVYVYKGSKLHKGRAMNNDRGENGEVNFNGLHLTNRS